MLSSTQLVAIKTPRLRSGRKNSSSENVLAIPHQFKGKKRLSGLGGSGLISSNGSQYKTVEKIDFQEAEMETDRDIRMVRLSDIKFLKKMRNLVPLMAVRWLWLRQ